ncbi:MAG: 2-thiouracil desulfurase family protein [Patescibacteria group bacterium]
MKICSACLLGINCRYDGKSKINKKVINLSKKETLIPVCPEQLGGLATPREQVEQKRKKVFTKSGQDVSESFNNGAKQVLRIAKMYNIKEAILKQRSPSCGSGKIYDGTFSGKIIKGDGITVSLLKKNGIKIISEEEL